MAKINIRHRIAAKEPTMLAAWPGMGNVGLGAIDYLRRRLEAKPFAEVDASGLSPPEAILVERGMAKIPPLSKNILYYCKHLNLVILEGETQMSGREATVLMDRVLDLAQEIKVRRIYTGAAFPLPMSHTDSSRVFGVANKKSVRDLLTRYKVRMMEGGQISGLNGLMVGFAANRGIEAACLLATLPYYAVNFPNPKASKAIVGVLARLMGMRIDTVELDLAVQEMDGKMEAIEEKIRELFPEVGKEEGKVDMGKDEIPGYIMEKIEKLFQEAGTDRKKAYVLKQELDRWNLYQLYEDRFLDLFKESQ